jgi:hypothetical protein
VQRKSVLPKFGTEESRALQLIERKERRNTSSKGMLKGKRDAGVLIGFESEDDWFDYKLETNRVFLERVEQARRSLKAGRRIRLEDIPK